MKATPGGYKRILFDVLGVLLIIAGLSLGWLPGPGGIPLILAGLGLLSINNHWAKRIIVYIEKYADNARLIIFPNNKAVKIIHNIIAFILLLVAIWLIAYVTTAFSIGIGISLLAIAMAEVLMNYNLIKKLK
jgi:hypothetical protein